MKKALMIVAIIALVAIAGSVIYYYVFYKPGMAKADKVEEYVSEYNTIRQDFIDTVFLYMTGGNKTPLSELQEIRRKLIALSVPEGYDKSSCLAAMENCINAIGLGSSSAAKEKDIELFGQTILDNLDILKHLRIYN